MQEVVSYHQPIKDKCQPLIDISTCGITFQTRMKYREEG